VFESYFYDFNIFLIPGEKVKVLLKFNGHKYQSAGLQDLLRYFKWLTETVVQDMNTGIDQLSLLSGTEQDALISRFNRDICSGLGEKSFVQLLEEMSIKVPDHIAVRFGEISLTYAMLSQQSDNLAAYLRKKGVKKGDRVGILADRSEKLIVALIATLKLNACFVPIDPTMPAERRRYILKDAGIHFLFTMSSCLLDLADTYNGGLMALDIQLDGLAEEDFLSTKPEPDDLAYLIYTSGSTGKPKGVMIRHRGFLNYLLWANDYYFNNEAAYSFAFFTSLAFDLTITCIFTTLLRGDTIHIYEEKDVAVVLTEIFSSESGVNTVKLTPSHISLLESLESTDTSIRTVIVGGEALTKKQVHLLKMLHPAIRIYNEYGPTETTVGCTVKAITEEAADITIGKPINNTAIYILNNSKQVQPVGILGEIAIGGLGLAAGYLENDGLTSEKFIENPYKKGEQLYLTGDVGKWLPDGDIFYTGRKDNQVKIRGYRIEPGEVEMVGLRYSGILECLCMPDEQCNALIFYYRSDTPLDAQQLQRYFGHHLPAYMVPAIMIPVQAFLLTANGKIDRRKLPDPQQQRYGHIVLPENEMERGLLKIWQEVLEQTEISVEDKFFSIGGHSLKATQVASRILREIRIKVSLKDIFDYDTIRELARIISQQTVVNEAEISPAPTSDYYPLSHSQQRIWVSSRLQEEQLFYTPASSFIFDASFNLTGFENGVKKLIARHEVLRTTFDVRNGEAVQFIHPYEERMYTAEVINVRRDTVKQVMDEEACQPFDLGNGPLFRVKILHVDNDQYLVLFSCHHIISDGWSLEVLMKEFNHYYQSFSRHITPDAPPLRIQYKDYAHWHNALLRSGTAPMKTYWLGKLAGRLPVLQLPADYVRPAKKSGGAGIYRFTINKDLTHKLSSLTVEKGATIFMSLLACIKILIFHLTGEKDIIVGTPVAGRVHKELEEQLGNYLNILALRDELHERLTFADLLQHIRTTVIEAYDYQLYPFDLLLEELHYPRQQDRNPVFDIGFTLQNQVAPEEDRGQDHSEPADDAGKNFRGADTDLWWVATQMKDQISMSLHYDRQLFKTATMTSFAEGLQIIIDKATARINSTIAEITPFQTKVPDRKLNINLKI
jgi:amino acid adenylation domain-containing protein